LLRPQGLLLGLLEPWGLRLRPLFVRSARAARAGPATPGAGWQLKLKRGVLANGMRYVLLRHVVPQGRCEAHLEFHVGSVDEQEDQRGMAHMLEHICFLGSEKRMQLQSSGLGMTSNACTDFNHTVYYVSIGSEHVQEGLQVLSDVGFQPAFKPERVEKERAAVLSEAQMVNDCQYRLQTQFLSALHGDNCIHTRFPIGLEQQIASWTVEELRRFHSRWYVPENATLFIVGDIDEEETIQQVNQAFANIPQAGLSVGEPWQYDATSLLRPKVDGRPEILHRFVQPADALAPGEEVLSLKEWQSDLQVSVATNELMQGMQVTWAAKTPLSPARNLEGLSEWLCQRLVVEAVRLRFSSRWRSGVIPCSLHSYDSAREAVTITTLTIMAEPSRWQDRCEEVLEEVLTITCHGVAEEELDLAKRMCLDRVAEAAASQPWSFMGTLYGYDAAGTSREIVEALIASTPTGHLLTSAPSFSEALKQVAEEITLERFNESLRSMLGFLGPAESARGAVVVSCPATVADELSGRKVPFTQPSAQQVESVLRSIQGLDASEAAARRVSAPASLAPEVEHIPEALEVKREDVTTIRLANGLVVRLLVMPASPSSGPARAGMRLTVPGGRVSDELAGRLGASHAMLMTLNNGGAGQWSQDEVQLFRALNSVQTDFRAAADALELDVFMSPTATSCRAALEWLHWALKEPKLDLQGFADSQLRMKGDALAREKSLEKRSLQAALEHMYPSHRWLDDVSVLDVNKLTLGMVKKAAASQMQSVQGLELDLAICIARLGDSGGLMHEEEFEDASMNAEEEEAVKEMRKTLETEIGRCLGTLPAVPRGQEFSPPTPSASSRGTELRVHIPDNEARAMVLVGGFAPGYWGRGDKTWQCTSQYKNFSWGPRAEQHPLYPARATELMMECMNTRLLGRVRDQLSPAYNCDIELTMFEGFDAGHFFCKVFTFPQTLREAAAAAVQVLRSPGPLPFTDHEVEASKKVMAWREGRRQREDRSYWLGRLKLQGNGEAIAMDESRLLESLGADDVQLAWKALGGLDDPTVVLTTSGTPDVAAVLRPQDLPVVQHSDFPEAVLAQEALAPKSSSKMDFLD